MQVYHVNNHCTVIEHLFTLLVTTMHKPPTDIRIKRPKKLSVAMTYTVLEGKVEIF